MAKKMQKSNISHPWNDQKPSGTGVRCGKCGNDGMDGTITGRSGQWNNTRICLKPDPKTGKLCNHTWHAGIGVQIADFSRQSLSAVGDDRVEDDRPVVQNLGPSFRDPTKNHDRSED